MMFNHQSSPTMPGNYTYSVKQHTSWDYPHYASDSKEATAFWLNAGGRQYIGHVGGTYIPALNFDPQPPFTPCLTPASSIGSSAASSPRFLAVTPCEEERKLLPGHMQSHSPRDSPDSQSSRSSLRPSASPQLSQALPPSKERPTRFIQHQDARYSPPSVSESQPKKKARSSRSTFTAYTPPSTVSLSPTRSTEPTFDPVKKSSKQVLYENSSRGSRRRKEGSEAESQPIKFRFVSVQHSADVAGPSGVAEDEEQRIRLEEHMEEDIDEGPFEHGPTEFPPRPYTGGDYVDSPLRRKKPTGKIPASNLDFLPVLEARFTRLETAIDRYVEMRSQQALRNSQLPSTPFRKLSSLSPKGL